MTWPVFEDFGCLWMTFFFKVISKTSRLGPLGYCLNSLLHVRFLSGCIWVLILIRFPLWVSNLTSTQFHLERMIHVFLGNGVESWCLDTLYRFYNSHLFLFSLFLPQVYKFHSTCDCIKTIYKCKSSALVISTCGFCYIRVNYFRFCYRSSRIKTLCILKLLMLSSFTV